MRGARIMAVAVSGALLLATAACGDDDDGASTKDKGGSEALAKTLVPEDCQFLVAGAFANPASGLQAGGKVDFSKTGEELEHIADDAPDEIERDLHTIAERLQQMGAELKGVDLTDPAAYRDPKVQNALKDSQTIFDDEYRAAADSVSQYVAEHCNATTPGG